MARLRFPGRPGHRFGRLGIKYGADEQQNEEDPTTRLIANIHRGLQVFRETFGDSDEEEFPGFSQTEIAKVEKKLLTLTANLQEIKDELKPKDSTCAVHDERQRRTRLKKETRHAIEGMIKAGHAQYLKTGTLNTLQDAKRKVLESLKPRNEDSDEDEEESPVKLKSIKIRLREDGKQGEIVRGPGRPTIFEKIPGKKIKVKFGMFSKKGKKAVSPKKSSEQTEAEPVKVHRKRGPKKRGAVAKKILHKARKTPPTPTKKLRRVGKVKNIVKVKDKKMIKINKRILKEKLGRKPSAPVAEPSRRNKTAASPLSPGGFTSPSKLVRKQFIIPVKSARSSRQIKPNKRFLDEDIALSTIVPNLAKPGEVEQPEAVPQIDAVSEYSENAPHTDAYYLSAEAKKRGSLEAPLIIEGKRERKPSMKLIMKLADEDTVKRPGEKEKPDEVEKVSRRDKNGKLVHSMKRSGRVILQKAKLCLNQAALNRSKAALVKTLQVQMRKEERAHKKEQERKKESKESDSSATSSPDSELDKAGQKSVRFLPLGGPGFKPMSPIKFSSLSRETAVFGLSSLPAVPKFALESTTASLPTFQSTHQKGAPSPDAPADIPVRRETVKGRKPKERVRCIICGQPDTKKLFTGKKVSCFCCRRFYGRRSIGLLKAGQPFVCKNEGKCEIVHDVRSMCSACRYRKCYRKMVAPEKLAPVIKYMKKNAIAEFPKNRFVIQKETPKEEEATKDENDLENNENSSAGETNLLENQAKSKPTTRKVEKQEKRKSASKSEASVKNAEIYDSPASSSKPSFGKPGTKPEQIGPDQIMSRTAFWAWSKATGSSLTVAAPSKGIVGSQVSPPSPRVGSKTRKTLARKEVITSPSDQKDTPPRQSATLTNLLATKSFSPEGSTMDDSAILDVVSPTGFVPEVAHDDDDELAEMFPEDPEDCLPFSVPLQIDTDMEALDKKSVTDDEAPARVGPRIKHVCRRAAVALGTPACFPSRRELTLSALPSLEKERILMLEGQRPGTPDSDDLSLDEIIRQARDDREDVITIKRTPNKAFRPLVPKGHRRPYRHAEGKNYKRTMRCKVCPGCRMDCCGRCINCKDMIKFGGRGVSKKACVERKCQNPVRPSGSGGDYTPPTPPRKTEKRFAETPLSLPSAKAESDVLASIGHKSSNILLEKKEFVPCEVKLKPLECITACSQVQVNRPEARKQRLLTKVNLPTEKPQKGKNLSKGLLQTDGRPRARRKWPSISKDNRLIKADYKESSDFQTTWNQGLAIVTSLPLCLRTVCLLCSGAGQHEFVYCNVCCEPFHAFCLDEYDRPNPDNLENWVCHRCKFCRVCGKTRNLLECDKCHDDYHPECLGANYPTKRSKPKRVWLCPKCVRCKSCGATTPGKGKEARWTHDFSLCYDCGGLMDRGNFCPVCHKCYTDDDWESKMMQCATCESWVHAKCENITDELYQILSIIPDDIEFICCMCSETNPAPWRVAAEQEMQTGFGIIINAIVNMKSSNLLQTYKNKDEKLGSLESSVIPQPVLDLQAQSSRVHFEGQRSGVSSSNVTQGAICSEEFPKTGAVCNLKPSKSTEQIVTSSSSSSLPNMVNQSSSSNSTSSQPCLENVSSQGQKSLPEEKLLNTDYRTVERDKGSPSTASKESGLLEFEKSGMESASSMETGKPAKANAVIDKTTLEGISLPGEKLGVGVSSGSESRDQSSKVDVDSTLCEGSVGDILTNQSSDNSLKNLELNTGSNAGTCVQNDNQSNLDVFVASESHENVKSTEDGSVSVNVETGDVSELAQSTSQKVLAETDNQSSMMDGSNSQTVLPTSAQSSSQEKSDQLGISIPSEIGLMEELSRIENSVDRQDLESPDSSKTTSISPNTMNELEKGWVSDNAEYEEAKYEHVATSIDPISASNDVFLAIMRQKAGQVQRSVNFAAHVTSASPNNKEEKDYPKDFRSIRKKVKDRKYLKVEEFCDDIVRIIQYNQSLENEQRPFRRKATTTVRSLFMKQMEACFPWFNANMSRLWEHNMNLPEGMLPNAVIPPHNDHTYAQWMRRQEECLLSPQPSPFKKLPPPPRRPFNPFDDDASSIAPSDFEIIGDDSRKCAFCHRHGDQKPNDAGRLLYVGQDEWVHINCGLWSAEVYEDGDGSLQQVPVAVVRGRKLKCDHCNRSGATVGCCANGCSANFHFMCARERLCVFQEDKKVFCKTHQSWTDGEKMLSDKFAVLRHVFVIPDYSRQLKKNWQKGLDPKRINVTIGSLTVDKLGALCQLSDCRNTLLPVEYCVSRVYWSTVDARRRCVYTCKVIEVRPQEKSTEVIMKDVTIVHDVGHPDYDHALSIAYSASAQNVNHRVTSGPSFDHRLVKRGKMAGEHEDALYLAKASADLAARPCQEPGNLHNSWPQSAAPRWSQSLSRSWPNPARRKSAEKPIDLTVLSPATVKLLNKSDLNKFVSRPANTRPAIGGNEDPGHELNLTTIVDRLNSAANNNKQRARSRSREGSIEHSRHSREGSVDRASSDTPPVGEDGKKRMLTLDNLPEETDTACLSSQTRPPAEDVVPEPSPAPEPSEAQGEEDEGSVKFVILSAEEAAAEAGNLDQGMETEDSDCVICLDGTYDSSGSDGWFDDNASDLTPDGTRCGGVDIAFASDNYAIPCLDGQHDDKPVNDSRPRLRLRSASRNSLDAANKTTPVAEEGSFKCQKCKRFYRTKESCEKHAKVCNFEVSTSEEEEEEEEEDADAASLDTDEEARRMSLKDYPLRNRKSSTSDSVSVGSVGSLGKIEVPSVVKREVQKAHRGRGRPRRSVPTSPAINIALKPSMNPYVSLTPCLTSAPSNKDCVTHMPNKEQVAPVIHQKEENPPTTQKTVSVPVKENTTTPESPLVSHSMQQSTSSVSKKEPSKDTGIADAKAISKEWSAKRQNSPSVQFVEQKSTTSTAPEQMPSPAVTATATPSSLSAPSSAAKDTPTLSNVAKTDDTVQTKVIPKTVHRPQNMAHLTGSQTESSVISASATRTTPSTGTPRVSSSSPASQESYFGTQKRSFEDEYKRRMGLVTTASAKAPVIPPQKTIVTPPKSATLRPSGSAITSQGGVGTASKATSQLGVVSAGVKVAQHDNSSKSSSLPQPPAGTKKMIVVSSKHKMTKQVQESVAKLIQQQLSKSSAQKPGTKIMFSNAPTQPSPSSSTVSIKVGEAKEVEKKPALAQAQPKQQGGRQIKVVTVSPMNIEKLKGDQNFSSYKTTTTFANILPKSTPSRNSMKDLDKCQISPKDRSTMASPTKPIFGTRSTSTHGPVAQAVVQPIVQQTPGLIHGQALQRLDPGANIVQLQQQQPNTLAALHSPPHTYNLAGQVLQSPQELIQGQIIQSGALTMQATSPQQQHQHQHQQQQHHQAMSPRVQQLLGANAQVNYLGNVGLVGPRAGAQNVTHGVLGHQAGLVQHLQQVQQVQQIAGGVVAQNIITHGPSPAVIAQGTSQTILTQTGSPTQLLGQIASPTLLNQGVPSLSPGTMITGQSLIGQPQPQYIVSNPTTNLLNTVAMASSVAMTQPVASHNLQNGIFQQIGVPDTPVIRNINQGLGQGYMAQGVSIISNSGVSIPSVVSLAQPQYSAVYTQAYVTTASMSAAHQQLAYVTSASSLSAVPRSTSHQPSLAPRMPRVVTTATSDSLSAPTSSGSLLKAALSESLNDKDKSLRDQDGKDKSPKAIHQLKRPNSQGQGQVQDNKMVPMATSPNTDNTVEDIIRSLKQQIAQGETRPKAEITVEKKHFVKLDELPPPPKKICTAVEPESGKTSKMDLQTLCKQIKDQSQHLVQQGKKVMISGEIDDKGVTRFRITATAAAAPPGEISKKPPYVMKFDQSTVSSKRYQQGLNCALKKPQPAPIPQMVTQADKVASHLAMVKKALMFKKEIARKRRAEDGHGLALQKTKKFKSYQQRANELATRHVPVAVRPQDKNYQKRAELTASLLRPNVIGASQGFRKPFPRAGAEAPPRKVKQSRKENLTNTVRKDLPEVMRPHPLIHPKHHHQVLPEVVVEEEIQESPPTMKDDTKSVEGPISKDSPHLMFEITSDDGFYACCDSLDKAWKAVTDQVQDARANARMKQISYAGLTGGAVFGLTHRNVTYLLEQLPGAKYCRNYQFKHFSYEEDDEDSEPEENPTGCLRSEPFTTRKPIDMFSFLMNKYRQRPPYTPTTKAKEQENLHKSQRRATSLDLPLAMRFRHLRELAKEAVGAYRSRIHGRGLFCKRDIDAGEMIIEYAGEVIRSMLTDKREQYYEGKGIGCYMFRIDDDDVVDATMNGNAARFINHSCDPNCYSKVITVDFKKHIVIFAMRAIKKGEELTYDYKFPYEEVKIPCTCGSKRCRKYLN